MPLVVGLDVIHQPQLTLPRLLALLDAENAKGASSYLHFVQGNADVEEHSFDGEALANEIRAMLAVAKYRLQPPPADATDAESVVWCMAVHEQLSADELESQVPEYVASLCRRYNALDLDVIRAARAKHVYCATARKSGDVVFVAETRNGVRVRVPVVLP